MLLLQLFVIDTKITVLSIQTSSACSVEGVRGLSFVHGGGRTGTQPDSPRPAPKLVFSEAAEEATVAIGAADVAREVAFAVAADAVVVTVVAEVVGAEFSPSR